MVFLTYDFKSNLFDDYYLSYRKSIDLTVIWRLNYKTYTHSYFLIIF